MFSLLLHKLGTKHCIIYLELAAKRRKHQKQLKVWVNHGSFNKLVEKRTRASTLLFTPSSSEENKIKGDRLFCSFLLKKSQPLLLLSKFNNNKSVPKKRYVVESRNTDVCSLPGLVSDLPEQPEWHLYTHWVKIQTSVPLSPHFLPKRKGKLRQISIRIFCILHPMIQELTEEIKQSFSQIMALRSMGS